MSNHIIMIEIHFTITHLILIIESESVGKVGWDLAAPCMGSLIDKHLLRYCSPEGSGGFSLFSSLGQPALQIHL